MKRLLLTGLILMLSVGVAWAGPIYSKNVSSSTDTEFSVVVPAQRGKKPVLIGLSLLAAASGNDIDFYEGDATKTTLSAAEAAGQTAISLTECGGLDDNDYLVFQDKDGDPIEMTQMSVCNDTTNVATVTALVGAYQSGANVFEMKLKFTWDDIGTDRILVTGPLFAGTKGYPLAAIADTAGILEIETFTVEYR